VGIIFQRTYSEKYSILAQAQADLLNMAPPSRVMRWTIRIFGYLLLFIAFGHFFLSGLIYDCFHDGMGPDAIRNKEPYGYFFEGVRLAFPWVLLPFSIGLLLVVCSHINRK